MRKTITFAGLLLLLNACGSMSGTGWATDSSGYLNNASDLGDGQWRIKCYMGYANCTERARAICPDGFEILDADSKNFSAALGALMFDGPSEGVATEMFVKCVEPATEEPATE